MANLRDIKKRINSTSSTRQITHTMEMVSSAKIRKATDRIDAATPYADSMLQVLLSLVEGADTTYDQPLLEKHDEKKNAIFIVVVSDRGLAGGFNSNVLGAADKKRRAYEAEGIKVDLIICGKRGITYFNYREVQPVMSYVDLSADPTIFQAREIAAYVSEKYADNSADEVLIFYNHARNAADQDLREEHLLPLQTDQGAQKEEKKVFSEFEFEPSPSEVLNKLVPDYVITMVYRALLDSAAAEQGARRRAMKSATDNATEIISTLKRQYNRARQAAITTELNEIVGGAAALED